MTRYVDRDSRIVALDQAVDSAVSRIRMIPKPAFRHRPPGEQWTTASVIRHLAQSFRMMVAIDRAMRGVGDFSLETIKEYRALVERAAEDDADRLIACLREDYGFARAHFLALPAEEYEQEFHQSLAGGPERHWSVAWGLDYQIRHFAEHRLQLARWVADYECEADIVDEPRG